MPLQTKILWSPGKGTSIKYVTLFWINFEPPLLVTLCHTSRNLLKNVTHLGPPTFSSTCIHSYILTSLQKVCLSSRGFLFGEFCPGCFVWKVLSGVVLFVPPSVTIHLLQQKVKHHFQF